LIMSAALQEGYGVVWLALLFASAGVFHHAGIKIPFFAFFAHDAGIRAKEPPINMLIAMAIAAVLCVFIGSYPWLLYSLLPFTVEYMPFNGTHVIAQLQLLFFSALAFTWLKLSGLYPPELRSVNLDAEWIYRRLVPRAARRLIAALRPLDSGIRAGALRAVAAVVKGLSRHHGQEGVLARTWPTGSMVLWIAVLLGVYLVLYYR
ncbi:MAG: Na(+)/H(+) antiporter subunit D, partial [Gammaproteobacteria bacterium]